jgi:hypothetical protein
MTIKFNRQFNLKVETNTNEILEIKTPFTIEFSCKRNVLASANTGNFKVYNLAERTRSLIYKDKFDVLNIKGLEFRAGYDTDAPIIFRGNVQHCFSYRNGVNVITEIECYDGGNAITNSFTNFSIESGESNGQIIQRLVNDLSGVQGSNIGNIEGQTKRGKVLFGNTAMILTRETNNSFFIDNEVANVLAEDEVIEGDIPVITAESGLLEAPRRSDTQLNFKILFEPALLVGQIVELRSQVNNYFNGQYKVEGIEHTGTISEAVGGACETMVSLRFGDRTLEIIK